MRTAKLLGALDDSKKLDSDVEAEQKLVSELTEYGQYGLVGKNIYKVCGHRR